MNVQRYWGRLDARAHAVALFAGLGLLYNLAQALVLPVFWEDGTGLDWSSAYAPLQPLGVVVRVGITAVSAALLLWMIRPGQRGPLEWLIAGGWLVFYSVAVGLAYTPVALVMVLPAVLRYWWPRRQTVLVTLLACGLVTALTFMGSTMDTASLNELFTLMVLTASQGAFAFAAFELMVRRDEERAALSVALTEVRHYRGLELQHATLEERTRLSRELHDTLGHELTALRLEIQQARLLTGQPAALQESLNRAMTRSGESMRSLQGAVRALRPQVLDGTLYQALSQVVRAWPAPVQVNWLTPEPPLSEEVKLAAFRCVQEALTNALRHAPGQDVTVNIGRQEGAFQVIVWNRVTVDAPRHEDSTVSGLSGLRARLTAVGATLQVNREHGRFTVQATFPVEAA